MNKKNTLKFSGKTSRGFTLVELLVYLAIVSFLINSFVVFALNIINLGSKSNRQEEVYSTAALMSEKIKYEIRNGDDINTSSSDFDINLASNPGKKISLAASGSDNPILIDVSGGQARISRGGTLPVSLNPVRTAITDLTFTNLSSIDGLTKHLKFTLTVVALDPSPGNVFENTSLESSAELRSH